MMTCPCSLLVGLLLSDRCLLNFDNPRECLLDESGLEVWMIWNYYCSVRRWSKLYGYKLSLLTLIVGTLWLTLWVSGVHTFLCLGLCSGVAALLYKRFHWRGLCVWSCCCILVRSAICQGFSDCRYRLACSRLSLYSQNALGLLTNDGTLSEHKWRHCRNLLLRVERWWGLLVVPIEGIIDRAQCNILINSRRRRKRLWLLCLILGRSFHLLFYL